MKQTSKKVVSMLMALTMLIGMMTAVTVSAAVEEWEVVKTINFDDYEAEREITTDTGSYKDIYTPCTGKIVVNADDSNDHELFVSGSTSGQHRLNVQGLPFEQGGIYKITFNAKANVPAGKPVNMNTFTPGVTYKGNKALSTDWKPFEMEYTHSAETTDSGVIVLCTNVLDSPEVNKTWIDDFVVYKKNTKPAVTVKIKNATGGAVTYNNAAVSYGEKVIVEKGEDVTLTVAPNSGYYATVTVDGVEKKIENNQITLENMTADSVVTVLFTEKGWENIYYLDFKDSEVGATTGFAGIAYGSKMVCVEDNGSKVLQLSEPNTSTQLRFNTTDITFEKGVTYRFTARVKGCKDGLSHSLLIPGSIYPKQYPSNSGTSHSMGSDWIIAQKMTTDYPSTTTGNIAFMISGFVHGSDEKAWVDYFIVEKEISTNDVTVTIENEEGGSVAYNGAPVTEPISVAEGTEVSLNVTPNAGWSAKVTKDGSELPITNGTVTFTVTDDSEVKVTFIKDAPVSAGIAENATVATFNGTYLNKPAVFVYSKLNNFTEGEAMYYGIYLWNAAEPDAKVELKAHDPATQQLAVAAPNALFAIRVYGDAITAGQTYGIQTFVGETTGEAQTGTIPAV